MLGFKRVRDAIGNIFTTPDTLVDDWVITDVKIVATPDLDAARPEWQTIISATKPGLAITFETSEQKEAFKQSLSTKMAMGNWPFNDVSISAATAPATLTLDVKHVEGAETTQEKLAPALDFLTEHYHGFDFKGAIAAQLAAEPASSSPITPGLSAQRQKRTEPPEQSSPRGDEEIKRQDVKGDTPPPASPRSEKGDTPPPASPRSEKCRVM